jgi:hypothetical protein
VEINLFQDGGQIKIKNNVDHHNANKMLIDSHLPQADPFSLVPTFNTKRMAVSRGEYNIKNISECAANFSFAQLARRKSLGRGKPATNS